MINFRVQGTWLPIQYATIIIKSKTLTVMKNEPTNINVVHVDVDTHPHGITLTHSWPNELELNFLLPMFIMSPPKRVKYELKKVCYISW